MQVFALGILVVQLAVKDGNIALAPFYLGLTGLARAVPGLALTLIAGILWSSWYLRAPFAEEPWLRERLGAPYGAYARKVRRFI